VETSARPRRGRLAGALATLLVVIGLLALVAVASRGDTPSGSADTRRPSHLLIDTLVTLYLVLMVFGVLVFVWLFLLRKDSPHERARLKRDGRIRSFVLLAVFFGVLALFLRFADDRRGQAGERPATPPPAAQGSGDGDASQSYEPEFALAPVLIVGGVVVVSVAALVLAAQRRKRALGSLRDPGLVEALDDVLAESLDDLRAEQDPRKAVVAAYARLERTLAAFGLPRRPAEGPGEYLARILAGLSVSHRSIGRLTALFERAKFSQHDVDVGMKEEAIDALETTRQELHDATELELAEREQALRLARERAAGA
jgi:Domain of unknown function (DUF4129)